MAVTAVTGEPRKEGRPSKADTSRDDLVEVAPVTKEGIRGPAAMNL